MPGPADGVLPGAVTVFNSRVAGVARLNPALLAALRRAATAAAANGVNILITSGWRSLKYQEQLLREATRKYGSPLAAARWVAPVHTSSHVTGGAVDVGPAGAIAWLAARGAPYGLCQTYRNEPWHYELRPAAVGHGCPRMYADPT
ncbi:MAG TPA: D-alanyl-D-alanine carboxypeptidase family protein, partial [Deinococcales bacterium]|nr:D-alanyl-D-alanine carboxypeptidase family protein [Deinococcales bacterium]